MSTELWTTRRLLEWTADYFKGRGLENPRLETEILLAQALKTNRVGLYLRYDDVPADSERTAFRELVKRRAAGEPSAYLTGHKDFYSLDFSVGADVLIPRPETETLVLEGVEFLRARAKAESGFAPRILDIGTGSGVLAVALARNLPAARLTAATCPLPFRQAYESKISHRSKYSSHTFISACCRTRSWKVAAQISRSFGSKI